MKSNHMQFYILWLVALVITGFYGCTTTTVYDAGKEPVEYDTAQPVDVHASIPSNEGQKIHVLAVGINEYNDPAILSTTFADRDAEAFAGLWRNSVPHRNIHLLTNKKATLSAIRRAIQGELSKAGQEDSVYLFFAGHGDTVELKGDKTTSGLLPYDARRNQVETYYQLPTLMADLKNGVRARNLLLVLDCCHSGAAGLIRGVENVYRTISGERLGTLVRHTEDYNWGVLTACRPEEKSRASVKYQNGFFTHWLNYGLMGFADVKENDGSGNSDGVVTFKELYDFVYERVKTSTRGTQHPVVSGVFHQETPMSWVTSRLPVLEDAEESTAILKIDVEPKDAVVTCDQKRLPANRNGIYAKLKPGTHHIRIARKGYETQAGQVSLIAGEKLVVVVRLNKEGTARDVHIQAF